MILNLLHAFQDPLLSALDLQLKELRLQEAISLIEEPHGSPVTGSHGLDVLQGLWLRLLQQLQELLHVRHFCGLRGQFGLSDRVMMSRERYDR